mmetsp:Transcript_34614/g.62268  ORF Transcript_34614/g.62268 Transcript_34614/m.62268 type:complete len:217 (+) Transcript_34614:679-1329(+)
MPMTTRLLLEGFTVSCRSRRPQQNTVATAAGQIPRRLWRWPVQSSCTAPLASRCRRPRKPWHCLGSSDRRRAAPRLWWRSPGVSWRTTDPWRLLAPLAKQSALSESWGSCRVSQQPTARAPWRTSRSGSGPRPRRPPQRRAPGSRSEACGEVLPRRLLRHRAVFWLLEKSTEPCRQVWRQRLLSKMSATHGGRLLPSCKMWLLSTSQSGRQTTRPR